MKGGTSPYSLCMGVPLPPPLLYLVHCETSTAKSFWSRKVTHSHFRCTNRISRHHLVYLDSRLSVANSHACAVGFIPTCLGRSHSLHRQSPVKWQPLRGKQLQSASKFKVSNYILRWLCVVIACFFAS